MIPTGWIVGYAIAAAVVVVVVLVVAALLLYATRIAQQAQAATDALDLAQDNTGALWNVSATNASARAILAAATRARAVLES